MATSEGKFGSLFDLYDVDGDGRISQSDIDRMHERVGAAFGLARDSTKGAALVTRYEETWDQLRQLDSDGDGAVTRSEYVAAVEHSAPTVDGALSPELQRGLDLEFSIADRDDDGTVTKEDFVLLFVAFGVPEQQAVAAFERLDRNDDGSITREEYEHAWLQFTTGSGAGSTLLDAS